MIGTIIGYILVGIIFAGLFLMCFAPFILSGRIAEAEERDTDFDEGRE